MTDSPLHNLVCKECKQAFVATEKWRSYAGKWCHECRRAYMRVQARKHHAKYPGQNREYRKANPEKAKQWDKARRVKRRKLVQGFKDVPCADCGIKYPPWVMQFDHVKDGKLGNIGSMAPGAKLTTLIAEIEKCEVVCANCHAQRTHSRRVSGGTTV